MRRSRALWSGAFISETVWRHNRAEFWGKAEPSPVLPKQALPGTQTRGGAGPIDFTSPQKGHAFDLYTPLMRAPGCQWWQFGWDTHTPTGFGTLQGDQRSRGARGREKTLYNITHSQRNLTVLNRASLVSWADTGKHTKKKSHLIQTWRKCKCFYCVFGAAGHTTGAGSELGQCPGAAPNCPGRSTRGWCLELGTKIEELAHHNTQKQAKGCPRGNLI